MVVEYLTEGALVQLLRTYPPADPIAVLETRYFISALPAGSCLICCASRFGSVSQSHRLEDFSVVYQVEPNCYNRAFWALYNRNIALHAITALEREHPHWSARRHPSRLVYCLIVLSLIIMGGLYVSDPDRFLLMLAAGLGPVFFLGALFRFDAVLSQLSAPDDPAEVASQKSSEGCSETLPMMSVLVPLYDEAHVVQDCVSALLALDYPSDKLEVLFLFEADDESTLTAFDSLHMPAHFQSVIVPDLGPRTKPKAMQVALPLLRGDYVCVYDAEDLPDPMQLRDVAHAFSQNGGIQSQIFVQCGLMVDNMRGRGSTWLTRQFGFEYASWFRVVLPEVVSRNWPLPLGGTSNVLPLHGVRALGGWDPYNVTEDADLGLRLYRAGYRARVLSSQTREEAPARFGAWFRQRTRWFKGWMQTFCVLLDHPAQLLQDMGWRGIMGLVVVFLGSLFGALLYPLALLFVAHSLSQLWALQTGATMSVFDFLITVTSLLIFVFGHLAPYFCLSVGAQKSGYRFSLSDRLLVPIYWFLCSLAAWRALWQLFVAPHIWEKTPHVGRSQYTPEN